MATNRPRNSKEPQPTTPKRKGRLNNMELLGIGLFFLALCLYGLSKCGGDTPATTAVVTEQNITADSTAGTTISTPNNNNGSSFSSGEQAPRAAATTPSPRQTVATIDDPTLYIIIDSLKMRQGPSLDSSLVAYLRYGEEVTDLGKRTVLEKIRISVDEVRTAPWVKIKTKKGKIGWAFGAGLQFYPIARETNLQEGANQ